MSTVKKLDPNYPVLRPVPLSRNLSKETESTILHEAREIFTTMGWQNLPEQIRLTIALDIIGFRDELCGLYTTRDPMVRNRRNRIHYWVNLYLNGECSADTVTERLRVSYLD